VFVRGVSIVCVRRAGLVRVSVWRVVVPFVAAIFVPVAALDNEIAPLLKKLSR
jgi:hypothetical protein